MTLQLQATDLVVSKQSRVILGPLSFGVQAGEKIAVVGNNGSGKTSLLRAIAGVQNLRSGHLQRQVQRLSYMPDQAPLEAHLSARDLLREWASLRAVAPAQIETLLQQLDLASVADRSCARLSLGFRQRVALLMSLLPQPDLLLLDEPANGLDPHQQTILQNVLQQFTGTLIVVTHQLSAWQSHCTRVLALNNGELVYDGAVGEYQTRGAQHV